MTMTVMAGRCKHCQRVARSALVVVLVIALALAWLNRDRLDTGQLELWLAESGLWAPLLFIAIYAIATVLFVPGAALTLLGGAVFGPWWGTLYNLAGATLGAALAFVIARYLAADRVAARLAGRSAELVRGVEQEGWRFIAFVRLVPLFPFNLLNYALGLTRIPLVTYVVASVVFMLPGGFAYTWLGYAGKEALAGDEDVVQKVLLALALLAAVSFLPRFVRRLRQSTSDDGTRPQQ
jgi:uncharacterized membrane protein YdjX (TVP38/TMEM64 family)